MTTAFVLLALLVCYLRRARHDHSTIYGAMLCDVCNPEGPCCQKR